MRPLIALLLLCSSALAEPMTRHADPVTGVAVVAPPTWKRVPHPDLVLKLESPGSETALLLVQAKFSASGLDAWEASYRKNTSGTHEPTKALTGKAGPLRYIRGRAEKPGQPPRILHAVLAAKDQRVFAVSLMCEDGGEEAAAVKKLAGVVFKQLEISDPQAAPADLGEEVTSHGVSARAPSGWFSKPLDGSMRLLPAGVPAYAYLMLTRITSRAPIDQVRKAILAKQSGSGPTEDVTIEVNGQPVKLARYEVDGPPDSQKLTMLVGVAGMAGEYIQLGFAAEQDTFPLYRDAAFASLATARTFGPPPAPAAPAPDAKSGWPASWPLASGENPTAGFRIPVPAGWDHVADAPGLDLLYRTPAPYLTIIGVSTWNGDGVPEAYEAQLRKAAKEPYGSSVPVTGKAGPGRYMERRYTRDGAERIVKMAIYASGRRKFSAFVDAPATGPEASAAAKLARTVLRDFQIIERQPAPAELAPEISYDRFAIRMPRGFQMVKNPNGSLAFTLPGRGALVNISVEFARRKASYDAQIKEGIERDGMTRGGDVEVAGRKLAYHLAKESEVEFPAPAGKRRIRALWVLIDKGGGEFVEIFYGSDPDLFDIYRNVALASIATLRLL